MKTPTPKREDELPEALRDILDRAVDGGADSIELEYVSEGVEVCFMVGSSGFGHVVDLRRPPTPGNSPPLPSPIALRARETPYTCYMPPSMLIREMSPNVEHQGRRE